MGGGCVFLAPRAAEPRPSTVRTSSGGNLIAVKVSAGTGDGYRNVVGLVNHGTPRCLLVLLLSIEVRPLCINSDWRMI